MKYPKELKNRLGAPSKKWRNKHSSAESNEKLNKINKQAQK